MRQLLLLLVILMLCSGWGRRSATAETVSVGWHSEYGISLAVATDATDGSCWAGSGSGVIHVSADGVLLSETRGLPYVRSLSVNGQDGSCWVVQNVVDQVVKLDRDGYELFRVTDLNDPAWVSVNSTDGSCWIADVIDSTSSRVVHLASDGTWIAEVDGFTSAYKVSVNQTDGSIWVPDTHVQQVVHLSADGAELSRTGGFREPISVSVNSTDGTCWVADETNFLEGADWEVAHLAADGTVMKTVAGFFGPWCVSVNSISGACWVVDQHGVTRISSEGEIVSRAYPVSARQVAASPFDDTAWGVETSSSSTWPWDGAHLAHYAKVGMPLPQIELDGVASALAGASPYSAWVGVLGDWDEVQGRYVGSVVERVSADGLVLASNADVQNPSAIGVDPDDYSCWVADAATGEIIHLSVSGEELARAGGFSNPASISVDTGDHSVWVADTGHNEVAHLDASGGLLSRYAGFAAPDALSASSEQCWVADTDHNQIVDLRLTGEYMRLDGFSQPRGIAHDDYVIWVSDTGHQQVVATYSGGAAWRGGSFIQPTTVLLGPHPGRMVSCYLWVLDQTAGEVVALSAINPSQVAELWRGSVPEPTAMGVGPDDGSVWVASADRKLHHFASDGYQIWRGAGFSDLGGLSVSGSDGSCWITDWSQNRLCRVAPDGTRLVDRTYPRDILPLNVLVDQRDGSAWVVFQTEKIEHVSPTGETLSTWTGFGRPFGIQYNPHDDSFWVSDGGTGEIIHLTPDGTVLSRTPGLYGNISVNPGDDSCWVADYVQDIVVHLAADGSEVLRLTGFSDPASVAVDPTDGSIWLAESPSTPDDGTPRVSHLSATGLSLWSSTDFAEPAAVTLDPRDRSVWVADHYDVGTRRSGSVTHLAANGGQLSRTDGLTSPIWLSVNPVDGSLWFADVGAKEVVHLVGLWDVDDGSWAAASIDSCLAAGIVSGYPDGTYHPEYPVTRDQMAVYISRALAGGDANVPEFTETPSFPDVDEQHWALDYVEYAVDQNVVAGYDDGTYHPDEEVTRAQMAVYVARAMVAPSGEAGLADYVPADPRDFPDVPPTGYGDDGTEPYWAYTHVEYCVENGVVQGYQDGLYHPDEVVTRAQMAVYVARAFDLTL